MWNHRVLKHEKKDKRASREWYTIHEVYYNKKGEIVAYTDDPVYPYGESKIELLEEIMRFMKCLDKPILIVDDIVFGEADWGV
jgi:archaellum biogenesis ATPase FlaH